MPVRDVNLFVGTGRVANISELRETKQNKTSVCDILLATSRCHKNGNNSTTFIKCTFWNNQAEDVHKVLEVSDTVHVTGMIVDNNVITQDGVETKGRLKLDRCEFRLISKGPRSVQKQEKITDNEEDTF